MSRLTFSLLGPPEIRHGDRLLSFPTRKTLALLIYLVVEGGMQPRSKLATLFWPESERKVGRASLRTTLALLRKELAHPNSDETHQPHLQVEREAIGFNPDADYALDLATVESALSPSPGSKQDRASLTAQQTAATKIRGEFLEGFSLPDAPQFSAWVTYQQEQWHLRCNELLHHLAQRLLARGEPAGAMDAANRWLALTPLEERAYRLLMEAQAASGDRPGALQTYERCRTILADEMGMEPRPETIALAERIRLSRNQQRAKPVEVASDDVLIRRFSLPLTGRAEEHRQMVAAYHQVRGDRFRLVTIEGEAGIGKTRLAMHFLNWAATQGAIILQGRAFETGGRLPYQPIIDALRRAVIRDVDLAPVWMAELSRLFPELRERYPELPPPTDDEATAQPRLFEAVTRLGLLLCDERPLILFVDDVQWADAGSLDLLQFVTQRWSDANARILLLVGLRSEALVRAERDQATSSMRDWLARIRRGTSPERLTLAPLTEAGAMRLQLSATESFPPTPGFMPPGVRQVLTGRLARLSPTAFHLLVAGAVLGRASGYRRLCRVAGVQMEDGLAALDSLLALHLLQETEEGEHPYVLAHDKIRDVVSTEAGDARRRIFHERAYAMLSETGAPAAQVSHHARAAGLVQPAFIHTVRAGDNAMDLFAVRDAVTHYEEARALLHETSSLKQKLEPDQVHHLYYQLGRAYELLDEWDTARQVDEEMLALADEISAPAMKVAALNRLAAVAIQSSADVETAAGLLEQAIAVAERHGDASGLAEAEWNLAQTCYHRRDRPGAVRHGQRALELARSLQQDRLIARSHNILSYAKNGPASFSVLEEAEAHATAGRDLYERLGDRAMAVDCMNMLGSIALHRGAPREAVNLLAQARQVSREIENVWGRANTGFNLAQALLECGRVGDALTTAQESQGAAESIDSWLTVATLTVRGNIFRALLATNRALADHQEVAATFAATPNPYVTHMMAANLCVDYAVAGD